MSITKQEALDYHQGNRPGKIEVISSKPCRTQRDLSLAYTPGVAVPCLEIEKNPLDAYTVNNITAKKNADGSVPVQFGGCEGKIANCLPIMKGWNYTMD